VDAFRIAALSPIRRDERRRTAASGLARTFCSVLQCGAISDAWRSKLKCFYHHDADAVALCKNCARGLCPQCAAEVLDGLACRGKCEQAAGALAQLVKRNSQISPKASGQYILTGWFYVLLGVGCGYTGLFTFEDTPLNLITFFAIICVPFGGYYFWLARTLKASQATGAVDQP
jgi:hypothetical protein